VRTSDAIDRVNRNEMDDRWILVRDHRQLLISVDTDSPLSDVEADALAEVVSSRLHFEDVNEVVLIGLRRFDDARLANFHDIVRAVGTLANAAGKAFRIAR
jgi:hypothetical protein